MSVLRQWFDRSGSFEMFFGVRSHFQNDIIEFVLHDSLASHFVPDSVIVQIVLIEELDWNVASLDGQVVRSFLDHIANTQCTSDVRSDQVAIFIVDSQQVQIHVKHQTACVLSVDFQLLHRLDLTPLNVKKLKVNHSVQKL